MYIKSLESLPSVNASDVQWIAWYEVMRPEVGKKNANMLFLKAWNQRKNEGLLGSKANTQSLRSFLEDQGINMAPDGILAYPIAAIDAVEGFVEGAFGIGKWSFIIVFVLLFIIVAVFLFNIARNPKLIVDGISAYSGRG